MDTTKTSDAEEFRVPSTVPQDLLLIHDLVWGDLPEAPSVPQTLAAEPGDSSATHNSNTEGSDTDSIASSSSEDPSEMEGDVDMLRTDAPSTEEEVNKGAHSEEEVEAGLLDGGGDCDPMTMQDSSPENSDSDTSDSDSDSDDPSVIEEFNPSKMRELLDNIDDDADDEGPGSRGQPVTAHEVLNEEVAIPDIAEVDSRETLERVGEIFSVLHDKIVIVKGLSSQMAGHAPERVLDTDTLLVFEDRKVLGYIHETFGPTYQPLYQVRFNDKFPLDKERAQISRPIFHVPNRSNFVFVDRLKLTRGSDASNAHDEEPGEDEVEFSDDEEEAAYKRMLKERRSVSRTSSRAATPSTPGRRDYDFVGDVFGGSNNPYDEHGAYDTNYGAGPSRPPPMPYDDPYSDSFTGITNGGDEDCSMAADFRNRGPANLDSGGPSVYTNDRSLDLGPRHRNTRGRGRGGNRSRQSDRGRRGRGNGTTQYPQRHQSLPQRGAPHEYSGLTSPSNFAPPHGQQSSYGDGGEWTYSGPLVTPQSPILGFGLQSTFPGVQPHINPRFANQLGFGFSQMSQVPHVLPGAGSPPPLEQYDPTDPNLQEIAGHRQ